MPDPAAVAQGQSEQMRRWYRKRDLLRFVDETVIPEDATLDDTGRRIITDLTWAAGRQAE